MLNKKSIIVQYLRIVFSIAKKGIFFSFLFMVISNIIMIFIPNLTRNIIDLGIISKNFESLIFYCCIYLFLFLASNIINLVLNNYFETLKLKVISNVKYIIFEKLSNSTGKYLTEQKTGELLRILDNDLFQIERFGIDLIFKLFIDIFTVIITFIILVTYNFTLVLCITTIQLFLILIHNKLNRNITKNIEELRELSGNQSILQEQYISNLKNSILSNITDYFKSNLISEQDKFVYKSIKINFLLSIHSNISQFFGTITTIITYLIGGLMIIRNKMTIGELLAFLQYISLFISPLMSIIQSNINIKQVEVSLHKVFNEIDKIDIVQEIPNPININTIDKISFNNIYFSYKDEKVLDNLSVSFHRGEVVGIIGESGCGKSTLLSLLYRLWSPNSGEILINDISIKRYSLKSLREKICIISQDPLVLDETIEGNIKIDNHKISLEAFNEICTDVGLLPLINNKTLNENLGENGSKLSGGQKQRISIARGLIKNSDVLIFDEATSSLDNISQKKLISNLKKHFNNKIVIMIAHRFNSLELTDSIIMDNGKITKKCSYAELTNSNSI